MGYGDRPAATLIPLNVLLQRRRPEDIGLTPDGDSRADSAPAASASGPRTGWRCSRIGDIAKRGELTLRQALGSAKFWLVSGGFACALFVWYAILVHQTKYLQDLGFSTQFSSFALGLVPLFGVAGQIGLGALSDRIGREWIWTFACIGFALCYALLIVLRIYPQPLVVWLMVLAQGGLGYSLVSVYGAIPADLFRGPNYGLIYGTMSFFGSLGAALGPFLLGRIHDWTGSYDIAFVIAIGLSLLSILLIWLAAPRHATTAARTRRAVVR